MLSNLGGWRLSRGISQRKDDKLRETQIGFPGTHETVMEYSVHKSLLLLLHISTSTFTIIRSPTTNESLVHFDRDHFNYELSRYVRY